MPESPSSVLIDAKEIASKTFFDVAHQTRGNFPDPLYQPQKIGPRYYPSTGKHKIYVGADGTGTKPELAERLALLKGNMRYFESLAFDVVAMVADDAARDGHFVIGIVNALDVNSAESHSFIQALATGMKRACDIGKFPLLNGETAELGYRTAGVGDHRLNWNAMALQAVNIEKIIDGRNLRPGQPIVALREQSIRSNGLTRARAIVEHAFLSEQTISADKRDYIIEHVRQKVGGAFSAEDIGKILDAVPAGSSSIEQMPIPWHEFFPECTEELLTPSKIYAPLLYAAQGGVDGDVRVPIIACAHVSGGGVPLKGQRMVQNSNVGLRVESVFPDPVSIQTLLRMANTYPKNGKALVNERQACEQWNRGVGFMCVFENNAHANAFVSLASEYGYEAAIAGETTNSRTIEWRGETWNL